jgi:hypothetical protein
VTDGADGRISLPAIIATTGNAIATSRKMKIGRYPLGMRTI